MYTNKIKICYFPGREAAYSRNRVLIKGMRDAGISVFDCSYSKRVFYRNIISFFKFLKYKNKADIIIVGFMGQFIVPFVRLFTRKKIIFDALISLYQTLAFDRERIKPQGIIAKLFKFLDQYSCKLSDIVILDTNEHIDYFVNELKIKRDKFIKVIVGSDNSIMYPREKKTEEFIVHFHGEFQALHGTEYIVKAAKLLPNIKFRMIGRGYDFKKCYQLSKQNNINNIEFLATVSYEDLPKYIAEASICLGIFGNTQKTQMVIPHKVYEALAMQKPVITADTPAIRELLRHENNVLLCNAADPQSLADAITKLKDNEELRIRIAENGFKIYNEKCCPKIIGEKISTIADNLLNNNLDI